MNSQPNSPSVSFWNGVLVTYSAQMVLWRDPSGNVEDAINNTGQQHPSIYQLITQPQGTPNDHSSALVL